MHIVISAAGAERGRDLAQLRDWLGSVGAAPWQLLPEPPRPGNDLGAGVEEICAIVVAAAHLAALVDRIRDWFRTRHAPGPMTLTITLDPAEPAAGGAAGSRPDEQPS